MPKTGIPAARASEHARRPGSPGDAATDEILGRMLFEHALDAILLTEPGGGILDANRAACEMLRADVATICSLGRKGVADVTDPRMHALIAERAATGSARGRQRLRRADGELFEGEISSRVFTTPDGDVRTVMIIRELTELNRLEGAAASYEELFMNAYDAIAVVHLNGTILDINESGASMLGLTREGLMGTHFSQYVPDAELPRLAELFDWRQAGETRGRRYETAFLGADGEIIPVEITSAGIPEGDTSQSVKCVIRDLREIYRANREREDREARFTSLVSSLAEGIVMQDSEATILACNAAAERILGLTEDQMAGRTSLDPRWRAIHEDGSPFPGETHPAIVTLRTGEPCRDVIMGVHKPSGELTWISINSQPVEVAGGKDHGVVCSFADITARKQAEAAKADLEAQLHHADKLKSLGVLAGGIAHDFNNILVTVLGHASLAGEQIPSDSPARQSITAIEIGARRAADLAGQMLAFAGRGAVVVEPVSVDLLATEIAELLRASVPHQIHLVLDLDPSLPPIEGDPAQLRQVLLNLVTNAADAIGDTAGEITLRTRLRHVTPRDRVDCVLGLTVAPGDYVELSVTDSGAGMDPATQQRIFEPFFTTKTTGRGLGLAATVGIVRSHGGALELRSTPGSGSTFIVLLPVGTAARSSSGPADSPVRVGAGLVLVVDDESSVRDVVATMLERYGYSTLKASDGAEAMLLLAEQPEITAVALDVTMPGTTGPQLLESIREARPGLPVLLMSGYTDESVPAAQNVSFIQKPFASEELVRRLQETIARAGGL